jgi:hypothetical protein
MCNIYHYFCLSSNHFVFNHFAECRTTALLFTVFLYSIVSGQFVTKNGVNYLALTIVKIELFMLKRVTMLSKA